MKDFENLYTPYQEALDMKELGFNEKCFGLWIKIESKPPKIYNDRKINTSVICDTSCSAVLYTQAFKFFERAYGLKSYIKPDPWNLWRSIYILRDQIYVQHGSFETDAAAELALLKKLIEIAKTRL